jgi:trans-2,3-dihydro-3-hydroxyanthranilate isomerase
MANYRFLTLDVFTDHAFGGNPLAVFPEAEGLSTEDMLKIAREMNLSETVFVLKPEEVPETDPEGAAGPNSPKESSPDNNPTQTESQKVLRRLRIFTPTREIPFAGHPIVGTWNALAREGMVPLPDTGTGWTRILHEIGLGVFPVDIEFKDKQPVQVVMTQGQPALGPIVDDLHEQADIARALGLAREDLDESLPIQAISTGLPFLAVPVRALADLRNCRVNTALLTEIYTNLKTTGCCPFTRETIDVGTARAHLRMFAPGDNIPEDPATGSAAGALGAYLVHYGACGVAPVDGVFKFLIEQGDFINRPSRMNLEVKGSTGAVVQVRVGGSSVLFIRGELSI